MAMILDAFLGRFKEVLTKMAEEEVGMLLGVPGEIKKLARTVAAIQCVLSDAESRQIKDRAIEGWLLQLKDVMYDADDVMDVCQIKAEERRARHGSYLSSSKFSCGISMLSCLRNPIFAHKIGAQIKEINARLDEISKRKTALGLIEVRDVVGPSNVRPGHSDFSQKTNQLVVLDDIVGEKIEEDTSELVKLITTEEESVKENVSAVAVVGMPGIGKTTLAKKIFNDPEIQRGFPLKIWACVSKNLEEIELLKCIIREAEGDHHAAEQISELVPMLKRLVEGKKYFLVLDDVWPESQGVWDGLLREAMIGGARGSRLLVTTRDDRVARFIRATATHHVQKLSDEDAWCLLAKQVVLDKFESEKLKDTGLELVKKCDGLPLAIKAVGGILRGRGKDIIEWQTISKSTLWSLDDLPGDFPRAFYLSYEDLPSHLKQCFIFCSLFPEDFEFKMEELIYLWLAEGFLRDEGDLSFYATGTKYYKDLVLRNLLDTVELSFDQSRCKMHDLWRSFAGNKRNSDSFIMRERELPSSGESFLKLRRLSVENSVVDLGLEFLNKEKSIRTLLLINNSMADAILSNGIQLSFHLRIVDLSNSNISNLSESFGALVQLRYLNVSSTNLETLPNSIGNLRKLVYLNLSDCKQISHVPSSIVNLVELRHLSFLGTNIEAFPAGLRKLKKLVLLYGFKPGNNRSEEHSSLEDLGTAGLLSELILDSLEKVTDISTAKEANLEEKSHLKQLCFCYTPNQGDEISKPIEEKKAAEDVLNALSPPPSLEYLEFWYYYGDRLPNWLHVGTNPSKLKFLRYLTISECECFSQLHSLGQLPNLENLGIKGAKSVVRIGREFLFADIRNQMKTEVGHSSILPFPQLNELIFEDMPCWEEWMWEEGLQAMPKLKKLFITSCPKLSSLPKGLSCHATSLEYLEIFIAEQMKSIEGLQSINDLRVFGSPNLKRISNLPNLSHTIIENCPNLERLENLRPGYRMELMDYEMKTLPEYLRKAEPQKLTVVCAEELLVMVASQREGSSEWQKFQHIPHVKFEARKVGIYATYQKRPQLHSSVDTTSS